MSREDMNQVSFGLSDLWRIDYLEGETTSDQAEDMKLLIQHSPTEKKIFSSLIRLRECIKSCDPIGEPIEEEYFQGLHDKIMKEVKGTSKSRGKENAKSIFERWGRL